MRFSRSLIAILLALSACATQPGEVIGSGDDQTYGDPLKTEKVDREKNQERQKPGSKQLGGLQITVRSPSGAPLPGAKIDYRGAENGSMITGRDGVASKQGLKVGSYTIDVARCGSLIKLVGGGAGAELTIVPGRTTTGSLDSVGWEPRFQPIQKATSSPKPPWKSGTEFNISVVVNDMCSDSKVNKVVDLKPWVWETSGRISMVGDPVMRSTSDGWLKARFRCDGIGEGSVVLRDPRDGRRHLFVSDSIPGSTEAFSDTCRS